jgi:hypothetical protein
MFRCYIGLSDAAIPGNGYSWITVPYAVGCWLAGVFHHFEWQDGAIRPIRNFGTNVYGCGLVLDPKDKLAIFFTYNGQLMGELMLEILRNKSHYNLINLNIIHN